MAEPVLTSFGGGGFLLAREAGGRTVLYDFFAQTPKCRPREQDCDFFPILADFGTTQQEFHVGMGSIATPGTVKGLFRVQGDLGSMPMTRIVEPAIELARRGVSVNKLQAYIFSVVEKIYSANAPCRAVYGSGSNPGTLIGEGETFRLPEFADTLETLAREGPDLFYKGDIGKKILADCRDGGGALTAQDLEDYRVILRDPLKFSCRGAQVFTNPPPSMGGLLIAFALELLKGANIEKAGFGSAGHLSLLARVMGLTNKARIESDLCGFHEGRTDLNLLAPEFLDTYRKQIMDRPAAVRGTTQISVIDAKGNACALTLSNGEGAGYMVPGTGIMMNNMLGEEDINPHGFHRWREDMRMSSMMAPMVLEGGDGRLTALGSGGSNRIRTAILQVLLNLLYFGMSMAEAVDSPRIHFEHDLLSVEAGFHGDAVRSFVADFPNRKLWDEKNLFFGGVHSVTFDARDGRFEGAGDPRRGGVSLIV